jgi:hypothetical protein
LRDLIGGLAQHVRECLKRIDRRGINMTSGDAVCVPARPDDDRTTTPLRFE